MNVRFEHQVRENGLNFSIVCPSVDKTKKYSVYNGGKCILSFGNLNENHYNDKIGCYKSLNHNNKRKRKKWLFDHILVCDDMSKSYWWERKYLY